MKTYFKTLSRLFQKHIARLFSLILIVLVSVGFVSGIGGATDKINDSLSEYYKKQNVSDFIVKSTGDGFTEEQIAAIEENYGSVSTGMSVDVYLTVNGEEQLVRLYFLDDYGAQTVNIPETIASGETLEDMEEGSIVSAEISDNIISGYALGTQIELDFADILTQLAEQNDESLDDSYIEMLGNLEPVTVTVGEIVQSPLTFALDGEPSYLNPEDTEIPATPNGVNELITLDNILYLSSDLIPTYGDMVPEALKGFLSEETLSEPLLETGDLYVAVSDRSLFFALSDHYKEYIEAECEKISELVGGETSIITLFDNYSYVSLTSYAEKVSGIAYLLMAVFLFVTALVALSTMTRLLEEERAQIACMQTLGYSGMKILIRYLLFAAVGLLIGGAGAYFIGLGVAQLIYYVFNYCFAMPPMAASSVMAFFGISFAVILAALFAGRKMVREKPAELLRPKVPKAGKKVFLEHIPLIWDRLSFKYKSTMRNVLRYQNRFLMTVIAVAVSTSLVLVGLALLDLCLYGELASASIMAIAVVVVVFAGLLTAVVIYTLTNINISERNRELATLMVLGYYDKEVAGYIYREIYVDTAVGIIFGYPLSLGLMQILFGIVEMGTIGGVSWFVWLLSPLIVLLFTFLITMALRGKIVKIDMNESLKAIE